MKELNFDTGLVSYSLNGKVEVSFNPTDANFVSRLYDVFDELDKQQEIYETRLAELSDSKAIFEFVSERDKEMRATIDGLFGVPVCDAVFGYLNVYAVSDGLPIWSNLLLAVIDEIDESCEREQKSSNSRLEKYLKKYHK